MQNDEEFFIGDQDDGSTSSDLELIVDKVPGKEEQKEENEGQNILDYDIESFTDKPWNKPGADITDYFNYGFNETTWREYCNMQRRKSEFARGGAEWTDEKYSGVRRGFNEIKREGEGDGYRGRRGNRAEREGGRRGSAEGQRWEGWNGRKDGGRRRGEREERGRYEERGEGRRHGYRDGKRQ
ncbi:Fip1 domain-containing protein [Encephalitozoon hellem]|uniref:Fip1 domain-containing protein n=1 Tax=Encephalitozoon hellem TaxID=27973 RepID=A0A9Q9F954_ENCHE|nr:polyadenylation factor I complex subunit FIP1-like protein [Encephalitozoon hellem ATCC 50504]AFM99401.1 polyadenylation factor I complex subunit FIP1-like protein [Encephalitozoon hellem ATCC 50504]KAG5859046.1 Fip1 domain-containing protein [Encephalitozoon hellem]UTX44409.1 Fip1 domain-containing protein [Encephalitozoon hellem]|eukprot:XP_003888382.1 polyadenylation factor I complex subunit FIP1-like protein [Encephalitozoon hellem ATCC 50504]